MIKSLTQLTPEDMEGIIRDSSIRLTEYFFQIAINNQIRKNYSQYN